jgi:hypothetical protein
MMDGSGAGFVSSGSCGVAIRESSGCNYKVQVYYQGIRNLDAFALRSARLTRRLAGDRVSPMEIRTVSFETLQRDKRRARKRDELRLARGEVTPEQLEEENSFIPLSAKITILNLRETMERYYGK